MALEEMENTQKHIIVEVIYMKSICLLIHLVLFNDYNILNIYIKRY